MARREGEALITITHARLRIRQGDFSGARRVLRALLRQRPGLDLAWRLLDEIAGREDRLHPPENRIVAPAPRAAEALSLAPEFRRALSGSPATATGRRIERLRGWLRRIERDAGPRA